LCFSLCLPGDEVPDWPVSVLKLVLGRVLKSTTTPAPEVASGRAVSDSSSGEILVVKDNKVESSTNEVQRTTTATSSQRLHFDPRMKELSNKTIIKMMTSIDIKVTASIQVDAKAVAAVSYGTPPHHHCSYKANNLRVSMDSKLSKMTLLNELSYN